MVGQIKMNFKPLCHYAISHSTVCKTWAIKYLIDHLSDETMAEIANPIHENGKGWGSTTIIDSGRASEIFSVKVDLIGVLWIWMIYGSDLSDEQSGKISINPPTPK